MTKHPQFKYIIELNIALIFMATSGVLARYIELPLTITIVTRAIIAGILLFAFCIWKGFNLKIKKQDLPMLALSGILMGLHWLTYFEALRLSNVAVGMISLFTFPIITSFLEPLLLKTPFQRIHLLLGLLVLVGIFFLVPEFSFEHDYTKALAYGVLSAFVYSLRNIIVKSKTSNYNGSILMMYQMFTIVIILSPFFFIEENIDIMAQLPANLALGIITTAIGHTLFLYSLKKFSVTSTSIMSCIQPVYGIVLAIIFLNELPDSNSIIGGFIVLLSVILESLRSLKTSRSRVN